MISLIIFIAFLALTLHLIIITVYVIEDYYSYFVDYFFLLLIIHLHNYHGDRDDLLDAHVHDHDYDEPLRDHLHDYLLHHEQVFVVHTYHHRDHDLAHDRAHDHGLTPIIFHRSLLLLLHDSLLLPYQVKHRLILILILFQMFFNNLQLLMKDLFHFYPSIKVKH